MFHDLGFPPPQIRPFPHIRGPGGNLVQLWLGPRLCSPRSPAGPAINVECAVCGVGVPTSWNTRPPAGITSRRMGPESIQQAPRPTSGNTEPRGGAPARPKPERRQVPARPGARQPLPRPPTSRMPPPIEAKPAAPFQDPLPATSTRRSPGLPSREPARSARSSESLRPAQRARASVTQGRLTHSPTATGQAKAPRSRNRKSRGNRALPRRGPAPETGEKFARRAAVKTDHLRSPPRRLRNAPSTNTPLCQPLTSTIASSRQESKARPDEGPRSDARGNRDRKGST